MSENTGINMIDKRETIRKAAVSEALHAAAYLEQAEYTINGMTFHYSKAILETELHSAERADIRKAYMQVFSQINNMTETLKTYALLDPILCKVISDIDGGE